MSCAGRLPPMATAAALALLVHRRKMFVEGAQFAIGIEGEYLGSASVLDVLFRRAAERGHRPGGVELEGIVGDGGSAIGQHDDLDHAERSLHGGVGAKVFALATCGGKAPWLRTRCGGAKHAGLVRVEAGERLGVLRDEGVPEALDLSPDLIGGELGHGEKEATRNPS